MSASLDQVMRIRRSFTGRSKSLVVQALHWLHDVLPSEHNLILKRLKRILWASDGGTSIRRDLQNGLDALPGWMRQLIVDLLRKRDAAKTVR